MSYGVRVVGRPETLTGFALAGLPITPLHGSGDVWAQLHELARDPTLGVLLVERDVYDRVSTEVERLTARRSVPLVVPFPSPSWRADEAVAEDYIVEMLRRAIGYRVRFR